MITFTEKDANSRQLELQTEKKEPKPQMQKYNSEPKFTSLKD